VSCPSPLLSIVFYLDFSKLDYTTLNSGITEILFFKAQKKNGGASLLRTGHGRRNNTRRGDGYFFTIIFSVDKDFPFW